MYHSQVVLDYGNHVKVIIDGGEYHLEAPVLGQYTLEELRKHPVGDFIEYFEWKMCNMLLPKTRKRIETIYLRDDEFRDYISNAIYLANQARFAVARYRRCPTPPP